MLPAGLAATSVYAGEWFLSCPQGIDNAAQCAAVEEKKLLQSQSSWLERKAGELVVHTQNGDNKCFHNGADHFFAVRYYPKAALLLIRVQYQEGNSYRIVDTRYGYEREIFGFPLFNASYTRFVTTDVDLESQYNPNNLSVYTRQSSWQVQYFIRPQSWGPIEPRWIDDNKIAFKKKQWDKPAMPYALNYREGNWWLKPYHH